MPPAAVYFVQHLSGHDERLFGMATGRVNLAHPAVGRIMAGLQPLDRIDLRVCRFDCQASLVRGLRHCIAGAEAANQGWRVFDADGVLRCKRFPGDAQVIFPHGHAAQALWTRALQAAGPEPGEIATAAAAPGAGGR